MGYLIDVFYDAKEYGSILKIEKCSWNTLYEFIEDCSADNQISIDSLGIQNSQRNLKEIINLGKILCDKYHIVVTNPPYMGSSGMNPKLSKYVKENYSDSKSDLFAVFMEKCKALTKVNGYYSMITQHAWMFLSSYEKLRKKLQLNTIQNMLHLGTRAFEEIGGEVVQTTAFTLKNALITNYKASYIRLVDFNKAEEKEIKALEAIQDRECGYYYEREQNNFNKIPGKPIAYWVSDKIYDCFYNEKNLINYCEPRSGLSTSDNKRFLRLWFEIEITKSSIYDKLNHYLYKWIPINKGGSFRRWYGNNEWVINYENDGFELKSYASELYKSYSRTIKNIKYYFRKSITWSALTSGSLSVRFSSEGFIFGSGGYSAFVDEKYEKIILALLNNSTFPA